MKMKVKCISNKGEESSLTIGKIYEAAPSFLGIYFITNDKNGITYFSEDRFKEVDDMKKEDETKEMEKENVLEIEFKDWFDGRVGWRVTYQNKEIFKRGTFLDNEIGVYSAFSPSFYADILYIRGRDEFSDNKINICIKEDAEIIKQKVEAVNEKYGIPKRWRAKSGEEYYYFNKDLEIMFFTEFEDDTDDRLYKLGNYFKTREEAEKEVRKIKELLKNKEQKYE